MQTTDLELQIKRYTSDQLIEAYKRYMNNRKLNDKFSFAYCLDMISYPYNLHTVHINGYKREELKQKLFSKLNEETIYKLIVSDYTRNQVIKHIQ